MNNRLLFLITCFQFLFSLRYAAIAQVGIGTTTPVASSLLDLTSTNKGLLIPRMTQTQKNSISSPATGLIIFQTDGIAGFWYYDGSAWIPLLTGNSGWKLLGNSGTTDGTNFLGTTDNIPLTFRVNNQTAGRLDHLLNSAFWGYQSGSSNSGNYNSFFGHQAGYSNTSGHSNLFIGYQSGYSNTTGVINNFIGYQSGYSNTTGYDNTFLGHQSGRSNISGYQNTFIGREAGYYNTNYWNTGVGYRSLYNSTGTGNTAVGRTSLYGTTSGASNTAMGQSSLYANTTGNNNSAFGSDALANSVSSENSAFGATALTFNTTGTSNVAVGFQSLKVSTTADNNSALGYFSLGSTTTGGNNTALGKNAGSTNTTGTNNTFLGYEANSFVGTYTNATAIGANAQVAASNALVLGGTGANAVSVGIGTTAPSERLETVNGNIAISNTNNSAGQIIFKERSGAGSNYTSFKAQDQVANVNYTLPSADGSNGQMLTTDGSGVLSWSSGNTNTYSLTAVSNDPAAITGGTYTFVSEIAVPISAGDVLLTNAFFNAYTTSTFLGMRVTRSTTSGSGSVGTVVAYAATMNSGNRYHTNAINARETGIAAGTWYYKLWYLNSFNANSENYQMVITKTK